MTVSKRGLRPLNVDGVELLWRFRLAYCGVADCPQDWSHVTIVGASRKGEVVTGYIRPDSGPVTPGRVARAARSALAAGWCSGERHQAVPE